MDQYLTDMLNAVAEGSEAGEFDLKAVAQEIGLEPWQAARIDKLYLEDEGLTAAEAPMRRLIEVAYKVALASSETINDAENAILALCEAAVTLGYRNGWGDAVALSRTTGDASRG